LYRILYIAQKEFKNQKVIDIYNKENIIENVKRDCSILFPPIWNAFHNRRRTRKCLLFFNGYGTRSILDNRSRKRDSIGKFLEYIWSLSE